MTEHETEMVPLVEAAKALGVSRVALSRLVREGHLTAYENPFDRRQRLIDMNEARRLRADRRPITDEESEADHD